MISVPLRHTVAMAMLAASAPLLAREAPATPEQRIERLEKQVRQVQRQLFPKGQPADTAGIASEPAATQAAVTSLTERLEALERQLAEAVRLSEENGFKLREVTSELGRLRADQDARLAALESRPATPAAEPTAAVASSDKPTAKPRTDKPAVAKPAPADPKPATTVAAAPDASAPDPAEEAYDEGYQLWKAGKYDQAVTSLRAFTAAFPKHRRASWANNLVGRALLDKGEARPAAEALLANYRSNPKGERAPDSLYYLGQALMKLGQPGQACKAYEELESVYGAAMRGELKRLLGPAKKDSGCN